MDRNGFRSTTGHLTVDYCPNRQWIWPLPSLLCALLQSLKLLSTEVPRDVTTIRKWRRRKAQTSNNQTPNCDFSWKPIKTKQGYSHYSTLLLRLCNYPHCCFCKFPVENWKWGSCYPSSRECPLVWQENTLHWPIASFPQAWLGHLYHSGQFVSFVSCNWSQYVKGNPGQLDDLLYRRL